MSEKSFEGQLLRVTPSFIEGVRRIDILRPLTEDDFTFESRPQQFLLNVEDDTFLRRVQNIRAGVEVKGVLHPGLHAEIMKVFAEDSDRALCQRRTYRENCEKLSGGSYRLGDTFSDDFRGCGTTASRRKKIDKVLPLLRKKADDRGPTLRKEVVVVYNQLLMMVVDLENEEYDFAVYQAMKSTPGNFTGLFEKAGVKDLQDQLAKAQEVVKASKQAIRDALNKAMLSFMEAGGWIINDAVLHPSMVDKLKETYGKGEAFTDSNLFN